MRNGAGFARRATLPRKGKKSGGRFLPPKKRLRSQRGARRLVEFWTNYNTPTRMRGAPRLRGAAADNAETRGWCVESNIFRHLHPARMGYGSCWFYPPLDSSQNLSPNGISRQIHDISASPRFPQGPRSLALAPEGAKEPEKWWERP